MVKRQKTTTRRLLTNKEKDRLTTTENNNTEYRCISIKRLSDRNLSNPRVWIKSIKNNNKKQISKNKSYQIGRRFEYRVKNFYEKLGYYVVRMYASKGPADLIAIKKSNICYLPTGEKENMGTFFYPEVLFIQCKNLKAEKKLSKEEVRNLFWLCQKTGGKAIHVQNINHKLVIDQLFKDHTFYTELMNAIRDKEEDKADTKKGKKKVEVQKIKVNRRRSRNLDGYKSRFYV